MSKLTPREFRQLLLRIEQNEASPADVHALEAYIDALLGDDRLSTVLAEASAAIVASTATTMAAQQLLEQIRPTQQEMIAILGREVAVREAEAKLAKERLQVEGLNYRYRIEKVWVPIATAAAGAIASLVTAWGAGFLDLLTASP